VGRLCRALDVSRAGFYAWQRRPPSAHDVEDEQLKVLIREAHQLGRGYYGSPRVHRALKKRKVQVSRKRIVRLMQEEGLVGRKRRRFRCTTDSKHTLPVATNLLDRSFTADAPNQRWVGDTTELLIPNGKLYLAAILDLFSRFVVGWAVSAINDRHLTLKALDMALRRRCPEAGLLHHSDRGSTYASEDYQEVLQQHGITCSMSRRGNCLDNAAMESWNSTLKSELASTSRARRTRRPSSSTTSRCSTTRPGCTPRSTTPRGGAREVDHPGGGMSPGNPADRPSREAHSPSTKL
jgi:transposase InsO family protein